MKNINIILFSTLFIFGLSITYAQLGINTKSPTRNTVLDLQSDNALEAQGFGLPRVDLLNETDQTNTTIAPKDGLMVFNLGNNGLPEGVYTWYNNRWVLNSNETLGEISPRFLVKLGTDFILDNQGIAPVILEKITGFNKVFDVFNVYNTATSTFTLAEVGLYNVKISFDYSILNEVLRPEFEGRRPSLLYGIYNDTDSQWVFRRYEFLIIDRLLDASVGQNVFTEGFVELTQGKTYSFRMATNLDSQQVADDIVTLTINALNSGSTGTSDATFLQLSKVIGL